MVRGVRASAVALGALALEVKHGAVAAPGEDLVPLVHVRVVDLVVVLVRRLPARGGERSGQR
jgi:hypothetical protein